MTKRPTDDDLPKIAAIIRGAADLIDHHGKSALDQTKDWESPLRATPPEGCRSSGHSDPTTAFIDRQGDERRTLPSAVNMAHERLKSAIEAAYIAALLVTSGIGETIDKLPESDRAGIGYCTGDHCATPQRHHDGRETSAGGTGRLRCVHGSEPLCDACRKRREREHVQLGQRPKRRLVTSAWSQELGRDLTTAEIAKRYGEAN